MWAVGGNYKFSATIFLCHEVAPGELEVVLPPFTLDSLVVIARMCRSCGDPEGPRRDAQLEQYRVSWGREIEESDASMSGPDEADNRAYNSLDSETLDGLNWD